MKQTIVVRKEEYKGVVMRKNLKEARQKAGMTQQQMADRLNISVRQYQRIEAGQSNGSFENWDVLEDILGIHQRTLRENLSNHLSLKGNRQVH